MNVYRFVSWNEAQQECQMTKSSLAEVADDRSENDMKAYFLSRLQEGEEHFLRQKIFVGSHFSPNVS